MTTATAGVGFLLPKEAAALLHCTRQTVSNWMKHGCKVNGFVVKLRSEPVGARTFIRPEWVTEFKAACQAARGANVQSPAPPPFDPGEGERLRKEVADELSDW